MKAAIIKGILITGFIFSVCSAYAGGNKKDFTQVPEITIKKFRVVYAEGKAYVSWSVLSSDSSYIFVLERYGNMQEPQVIAVKEGAVSPAGLLLFYSFADEAPFVRHNYYRLLIIRNSEVIRQSGVAMIYNPI